MTWKPALAVAAAVALLPAAAATQSRTVESQAGPLRVETMARGLVYPWGLAFLPDGSLLVTERPGRLRLVQPDGTLSGPLAGVPEVAASGQGGLLDVALDPAFGENRLVYLSYAEPGQGGAGTAVARGRLAEGGLAELEVIFRQQPKVGGTRHFGSRLVFAPDGILFVTLGDRGRDPEAQNLGSHIGTLVRIAPDGSVPQDNPFVGRADALPEIWSYGHRNSQGAAIHPETGTLWLHEHGPRGGDEINLPERGGNYGWPLVSWGRQYSGADIPDPPTRPDLTDAVLQWTPVIGASGMAFYTGDRFPEWRGDMLVGGLVSKGLVRLRVEGAEVREVERIDLRRRVRAVAQGPDGAVYVLTDESDGALLRLEPAPGG